jgi:catechol 2,3-dioxygenase-like lactoylglutathione lyase family enzyme
MIRHLAHLCFITNNLERIVTFYRDRLGLAVKFRFTAADQSIFGAYIAIGDTTFVEFFDQHLSARQWGGDGATPLTPGNRYGHFCMEVTGLPAFREILLSRGVEIGEIRTGLDGSLQAWLADPDGNRIELMEYTHASAQLIPGHEGVVRSTL